MRPWNFFVNAKASRKLVNAACSGALLGLSVTAAAIAEPRHGIAMYGDPQLPPDFVSLPYANPDAPKGGAITLSNIGTFDSLNPYIRRGTPPWQLRFLTHEPLMGRNRGEPFALYGVLAESIETAEDRSWVEFTLRQNAKFSDGSPVTVEDVIWSHETLGTQGHGRYRSFWAQVESLEATGPHSLRFTFNSSNRELALLAGMRPILQKAQWENIEFASARLGDIPIGSGPYIIDDYEAPQFVTLKRNPDYWGADLPFRRGTFNFDEITIDFYGDASIAFQAFKAGDISAVREMNADAWHSEYSFPSVLNGDVIKTEIEHQKPSGITGFVMNTRREALADWRVREALITAFNFEFINEALTGGTQPRITSYFSNSPLAMQAGPAHGRVAELLSPFAEDLLPGVMEGYSLPQSDGSARNRSGTRRALALLQEAGWTIQDGQMKNADAVPLKLNILLNQSEAEIRAIGDLYLEALGRLGIDATLELVDSAQFAERTNNFDFDLANYRRAVSLSPGNEQRFYWGSDGARQAGSPNWMGVESEAIDAMISVILNAQSQEDAVAATRALDRLLTAGRYVIPFWQYTNDRIAHIAEMKAPETYSLYGDGPDYMPQMWWWEPKD